MVPITSAGNKSGVNWIRLYFASISCARVLIASVFANPGTPSRRMCPSDNKPINNDSTKCFCPTIVWSMPAIKFVTNALCLSIFSFKARISIASAIVFYYLVILIFPIYKRGRKVTAIYEARQLIFIKKLYVGVIFVYGMLI